MKGSLLTSAILASLLAFSGLAVAQESNDPVAQDSADMDTTPDGVDSAQDVDPGEVQGDSDELPQDELVENSGVDSSQDVDPKKAHGDSEELPEEEMAPSSGVDSGAGEEPEGNM